MLQMLAIRHRKLEFKYFAIVDDVNDYRKLKEVKIQ